MTQELASVDRGEGRPTLQVFTGGCRLCAGALIDSLSVAEDMGFSLQELKVDGPEAEALGIRAAPSIALDGNVLFQKAPTREELVAALEAVQSGAKN